MSYSDTKPFFKVSSQTLCDGSLCVTVDAMVTDEVSNGYLFLDSLDDLFLLRDAVDNAIEKYNLKRPQDDEKEERNQAGDEKAGE